MNFFLDNMLSPVLARALNVVAEADGHKVCHLRELFDSNTPDEVWIRDLGKRTGWAVITADRRITKRAHELDALLAANFPTFFLSKGWASLLPNDQLWRFIRRWPEIVEAAVTAEGGQAFRVPVNFGKLKPISLKKR